MLQEKSKRTQNKFLYILQKVDIFYRSFHQGMYCTFFQT